MRLVPTGRNSEVKAVFDPNRCGNPDCGQPFDQLGTYRPRFEQCGAHGGHWQLVCRGCGTVTADTVCDQPQPHHPLEGHRTGPDWDNVQHGPRADSYCRETDSQRMRRIVGNVEGRRLPYKPLTEK